MAHEEQLRIIRKGVDIWNEWRQKNPGIDVELEREFLSMADLRRANLARANLAGANLWRANLAGANLTGAYLYMLIPSFNGPFSRFYTDIANLSGADLRGANLSGADLGKAGLRATRLIGVDFCDATLTGSMVYGASVWDIKVNDRTKQQDLVITDIPGYGLPAGPDITVDNIKVAQFINLLLTNKEIRGVIDTIGKKAVLILGRFGDRKPILDAIRDELRKRNYLPLLFDFDVPENRDITETVSLLARMARFIIADLTNPSSIPKELEAIVPNLAVPVQTLLEGLADPYAMFKDYWKYDWVLPPYRYEGLQLLLATLGEKVIGPAEAKVKALEERRRAIEAQLTAPRA
jgi:hypothetical protein